MIASQKSDFNKKDMNFFSEFTTSGSQVVSSFAIVLLFFVLAMAIALGSFLYIKIRVRTVQNEINAINNQINDPETALALARFEHLQVEVEDYRTNLFVVSQLDLIREENFHADSAIMDRIADSIPESIILTGLAYEQGQIQISGNSMTAEAPLEFIQILQDKGTFHYVSIDSIETLDSSDISGFTDEQISKLMPFQFSFTGALESAYTVTLSRLTDDESQSLLASSENSTFSPGESFNVTDINKFTADEKNYQLTRITINGKRVAEQEFQHIFSENAISQRVTAKLDIKLYYTVEGGEAQ